MQTFKKILCFVFSFYLLCSIAKAGNEWRLFFGGLHSHTSYSDGKLNPASAFDFARNEGKVDFWAVTDHYEQLPYAIFDEQFKPLKEGSRWINLLRQADEKNEDGKFVAIAGYEWFDQMQGHCNVFFAATLPHYAEVYNLKRFYRWLLKHPEAMAGFNHPSSNDDVRKVFNSMEYMSKLDPQFFYIEVNGEADLKYYFLALDRGWHVGPAANEDNHEANWGLERGDKVGVYATELSRDALHDAFKNRRFYATTDRNLKLYFEANGSPMGSQIQASEVKFHAKFSDPDAGEIFATAEIYTNGDQLWHSFVKGEGGFQTGSDINITMPVDFEGVRYFVFLVRQEDGDFAVSSPIWVRRKQF